MYTLIAHKKRNRIMEYGNSEDFTYQEETNYPMFISKNVAFATEDVNTFEVSEIPEEVLTNGIYNYCYTEEDLFYWDPNIEVPDEGNTYGIPNSVYREIKEKSIMEVQNELNQ